MIRSRNETVMHPFSHRGVDRERAVGVCATFTDDGMIEGSWFALDPRVVTMAQHNNPVACRD